jgi:hypothetical protein
MGLSFTIAAGPRQRSHSQVWVPRNSWPHFTVSDSSCPKLGGSGPRIYILQEQGGPLIPPDTGFLFRRLLRLAGLRWRYSTPPPHEFEISLSLSLTLRPTVSRTVCLGIKHPSGAYDQIFITVRQFLVCWCVALCDEKMGLSFTIVLALASAVNFGSESLGTRDHILLSQIRDFIVFTSSSL